MPRRRSKLHAGVNGDNAQPIRHCQKRNSSYCLLLTAYCLTQSFNSGAMGGKSLDPTWADYSKPLVEIGNWFRQSQIRSLPTYRRFLLKTLPFSTISAFTSKFWHQ